MSIVCAILTWGRRLANRVFQSGSHIVRVVSAGGGFLFGASSGGSLFGTGPAKDSARFATDFLAALTWSKHFLRSISEAASKLLTVGHGIRMRTDLTL